MSIAFEKIPFSPGQTYRLLRWSDNVRDIELCLPNGKTQRLHGAGEAWHFHPEIELTLVTRGTGRRFVGDHVATLESPDLVLIGSNLPHYWSGLTGSSGYSLQFVADADHPLWQLAETAQLRSLQDLASRGAWLTGPIITEIETLMCEIAKGDETQGLISFLKIASKITQARLQQMTSLSSTRFSLAERDPHLETISKAVTYVLEHFQEKIYLEDLLELTLMSKPTFCRQFKRHTGRTLLAFVNQVRIDYARQQLIESGSSITDIAFESGFLNLSHFNRQFRSICNCSPRAFRNQNM